MFNNKLYEKFYPLTTEEEKESFLDTNYAEIFEMVSEINRILKNSTMARRYDYLSKMKSTVSFLGLPKYKNITHNELLVYRMNNDRKIKRSEEVIFKMKTLEYNLTVCDSEKISTEEINYALELANALKRERIYSTLLLAGIVLVFFLWWL